MPPYGLQEKENVLKLEREHLTKNEWREWMRKLLRENPEETRKRASRNVNKKLEKLLIERRVSTLHTFLPKDPEIDIYSTIKWAMKSGLTIVVPRVLDKRKLEHLRMDDMKDLKRGRFHTRFPGNGEVHPGPYDLIIVPGLVFDKNGNRIGHGTGYYDVFLDSQRGTMKVGVCFPFQMVEALPVDAHDIAMDLVLTG